MDTLNCVICQSLLVSGLVADPGHDLNENGPLFLNLSKILLESSPNCNFDFNEFKSPVNVNGNYKRKICSSCHQQLSQFDTLSGQLKELQLKINEISIVIKNKALQSQLFRKGRSDSEDKSSFAGSANIENSLLDFDFNFDSFEDQGVENDTKVDIKVESSSTPTPLLNLTTDSQLKSIKLIGPHVNGLNDKDVDLDIKSKYYGNFGLKKSEIFLEQVQLPSNTSGPYNIKDFEIANFIRRDRLRINRYKNKMKQRRHRQRKRVMRVAMGYKGYKEDTSRKISERRERPRQCPICSNPRKFYSITKYEDHIRTHTGEFCAKTFRSEYLLQKHLDRGHINRTEMSRFKCPEPNCGAFCTNQTRLEVHIQKHQEGLKKYLCEKCPRNYSERSGLNHHVGYAHLDKFYKCFYPNCEKKLVSKDSLKLHIQGVHEKNFRFFCPEPDCHKGFLKNAELIRHMKSNHLGVSSYEFFCNYDQCTRRFLVRNALELHKMMAHSNERPFKCSTCSKGFARNRSLKDHEKLHTGIRDIICTYENCGQAYALKGLLSEHIRKHHKNPDKWLSKNVQNRKGFRRRVNRVQINKDKDINDSNQNVNE